MITIPRDFQDFLKLLTSREVEYLVIRMGHPPLRLEILTSIDGVEFGACFSRRVVAQIEDLKVNVISRDDLITNKRASGRHKDLDDLEKLDRPSGN